MGSRLTQQNFMYIFKTLTGIRFNPGSVGLNQSQPEIPQRKENVPKDYV